MIIIRVINTNRKVSADIKLENKVLSKIDDFTVFKNLCNIFKEALKKAR